MPKFALFFVIFAVFFSFSLSEVPSSSSNPSGSYLEEVAFMKKYTRLVELKAGDAALVIARRRTQAGRVLGTSSADDSPHGFP